ncbi:lysoplasmalogenase family protein [Flavobacterium sp. RSSA_27]|uniref:lysoplasmalogenase family protein n=1 Tax=Flavobacterium sp. RSSA_27 TaxID=3447667 RepID=UPI003F31F47C
MKVDKVVFGLYFLLCFLVGVVSLCHFNELVLYLKGGIVIVIALCFFVKTKKFSPVVTAVLLLSFFGETYYLFVKSYTETVPIVLFLCVNLIFLRLSWVEVRRKNWKQSEFIKLLLLMGVITVFVYAILSLDLRDTDVNFVLYIIYSIVFVTMFILSFANLVKTHHRSSLFLVLFGVTVFVSDLFFLLNNYFIKLTFLRTGGNLAQVIGYYFMTHYFLVRKREEEINLIMN